MASYTNSSTISAAYVIQPTLATLFGKTVGASTGNIKSLNGKTIGTSQSGDLKSWGPLFSPLGAQVVDTFINFEGLSNTVAPTTTTLGTSTFGTSCSWGVTNPNTVLTGSTSAQMGSLLTPVIAGGTTYMGTGTLGLQLATGSAAGNYVGCGIGNHSVVSFGYLVEWSIPDNDTSGNRYSLPAIITGTGDDADADLIANGTQMVMALETNGTNVGGTITVHANTVYYIETLFTENGTRSITVYQCTITSGAVTGVTNLGTISGTVAGTNPATTVLVGVTGAETESSGHTIWFDNVAISLTGGTLVP